MSLGSLLVLLVFIASTAATGPHDEGGLRNQADSHTSDPEKWMHIIRPAGAGTNWLAESKSRILAELEATLYVLQDTWFDLSIGRWRDSIDWTGAVLNTQLVATLNVLARASAEQSSVDHYFVQSAAYYYGEHAASLRKQAYDDMLWVVLSWIESVKLIHQEDRSWFGTQFETVFARRAASFYNITTAGWSKELCDGGMTWNPALEPYKNAITNELYITASVSMYLYLPHPSRFLLDTAVAGYHWLKHSNMTNLQGLYVDGFHISGLRRNGTRCDDRNEMVYTYNQGVILSGLRGLWSATHNDTYLNDGHALVRKVIRATGWGLGSSTHNSSWQGLGRAGIIEDYCDASASCDQNGHAFKGIYFHHLALFCANGTSWHREQCNEYIPWVAHNARAAVATRDARGRIGAWWGAHDHAEVVHVPARAIDYRNDASLLRTRRWSSLKQADQQSRNHVAGRPALKKPQQEKHDLNDRGRGRTVESHSGGVAVLRCLWELLDAKDLVYRP